VRVYDATLHVFCIVPMLLLHGFCIVCIDQDPRTLGRSEADRSAGLVKEEYETQVGRTEALLHEVRRRDGGAGEAVTRPVAVIR
jgi:hypothetical protein